MVVLLPPRMSHHTSRPDSMICKSHAVRDNKYQIGSFLHRDLLHIPDM
jgi:hypothetical protein